MSQAKKRKRSRRGAVRPAQASFNTAARQQKPPKPPRIRRRRRLVWLSIVPAFLVFLLGVHLTALNGVYARAIGHYEAEEWWDAYEEFRDMRSPNFVDPWKAHFNTATAAYQYEMYFVAERYLEAAVPLAPEEHRCDVLTNLSLAYEAQGTELDERADAEHARATAQRAEEFKRFLGEPYDASVFEEDYEGNEITSYDRFTDAALDKRIAANYFALAAAAVNDPSCQSPPPPDASPEEQEQAEQEQEQRESEQDRLEEQSLEADRDRQEIEQEASGDPVEEEPDTGETEEERAAREEAERQEQLEQRNEEAKEEAESGGGEGTGDSESDSDGDSENGSSGPPPVSNW